MQQQERTGQHAKKQHGFSRSDKPFSWPALLADQTGDGENFMRRYLQIEFPDMMFSGKGFTMRLRC
jgi:hypothetical protein